VFFPKVVADVATFLRRNFRFPPPSLSISRHFFFLVRVVLVQRPGLLVRGCSLDQAKSPPLSYSELARKDLQAASVLPLTNMLFVIAFPNSVD